MYTKNIVNKLFKYDDTKINKNLFTKIITDHRIFLHLKHFFVGHAKIISRMVLLGVMLFISSCSSSKKKLIDFFIAFVMIVLCAK